jgi:adenylate cyclase
MSLQVTKIIWTLLYPVVFFLLRILILFPAYNTLQAQPSVKNLPFFETYPIAHSEELVNCYDIIRNNKGLFYLSSFNFIYQFDGQYWEKIFVAGKPVFEVNEKNQLLVGAGNSIYLLNKSSIQGLKAEKIFQIPPSIPGQCISHLFSVGNDLYISCSDRLYCYSAKKLRLLYSGSKGILVCKTPSALFIYEPRKGIIKITGRKSLPLPNSTLPINLTAIDLVPFGNHFVLKTADNDGLYIYANGNIKIFKTECKHLLNQYQYARCTLLKNNQLLLGTKTGGLVVVDTSGKIIITIDEKDGLYENKILNLYADQSSNIWVVHSTRLSRIEFPSAFSMIQANSLLNGRINELSIIGNKLFLLSNKGLSSIDLPIANNVATFNAYKNCRDKAWLSLAAINQRTFAVGEEGLYELVNGNFHLRQRIHVHKALISTIRKKIFVYADSQLIAYSFMGKALIKRAIPLPGSIGIIDMIESGNSILLSDVNFKLYIITNSSEAQNSYKISIINLAKYPDWYKLFTIHDKPYLHQPGKLSRINIENQTISKNLCLSIGNLPANYQIQSLTENSNGKLAMNFKFPNDQANHLAVFMPNGQTYKGQWISSKNIKTAEINDLYFDHNEILWLGAQSALYRIDTKGGNLPSVLYPPLIKEIKLSANFSLPNDADLEDSIHSSTGSHAYVFKTSIKYISFHYTSSNFEKGEDVYFQTSLTKNNEEHWTGWAKEMEANYNNLTQGSYVFKVRILDYQGNISPIEAFHFSVLYPFYLRWYSLLVYVLLILLIIFLFLKWKSYLFAKQKYELERIVHARTEHLEKEFEKSEKLLENILPKETADELKLSGRTHYQKFNMATVLFSDIQGFTLIAEQTNPETLIDQLDSFFFNFDSVVEKYNIEKIKTIGDAYMCAGGIPSKNRTNPIEVVLAAIEMLRYMEEIKHKNIQIWDLRIGIHTGEVIAGVIGQKKLSYDIWGDTVNTASRMEASSEGGKINISGQTYELVKEFFICEYRGKMPVKYKGNVDMFFVKGIRPELSVDLKNLPNKRFYNKLQLLRLEDIEDYVLNEINTQLPGNMCFHNKDHTENIYLKACLLGRGENLTEEDLLIFCTAALMQNTGYLKKYDIDKKESISYSKSLLKKYHYSDDQINKICHLIAFSALAQKATTQLETLMLDLNFGYLGRMDLLDYSDRLFREKLEYGFATSRKEWMKKQIKLLQEYDFYTYTATKLIEVNKKEQILKLKKQI